MAPNSVGMTGRLMELLCKFDAEKVEFKLQFSTFKPPFEYIQYINQNKDLVLCCMFMCLIANYAVGQLFAQHFIQNSNTKLIFLHQVGRHVLHRRYLHGGRVSHPLLLAGGHSLGQDAGRGLALDAVAGGLTGGQHSTSALLFYTCRTHRRGIR